MCRLWSVSRGHGSVPSKNSVTCVEKAVDPGKAGPQIGAMDDPHLHPAFQPGPPERPAWPAIRNGLRRRCPNCGTGALFDGYLTLTATCGACGEDLSHARADDGPAYLSILVTAKVMGTAMLLVYETFLPSPWVLATVFSVGVVAMALYLLPRFKGLIVGVQWAKRMHGF